MGAMMKKLNFINNHIPPIFEIRIEDNEAVIYLKQKLEILKKDGSPNFEYKRLENVPIKNKSSFLDGMVVLINLMKRFEKVVSEQRKLDREKNQGDKT